jgi:hypothetical protein
VIEFPICLSSVQVKVMRVKAKKNVIALKLWMNH